MSQTTKGESAESSQASESESLVPDPATRECAPQSNWYARKAPESCLTDLAIRIGGEISLGEALNEALFALSALLPDCRVEIREPENRNQTSLPASEVLESDHSESPTVPHYSSACPLGQCEWRLSDAAEGPFLVVSLQQVHQPREVARILDIGERVAILLGAAVHRDAVHRRLLAQTEEIVALRQRVIQAEKLAGYGQLVASVLHDLNNPLTAILAYTEYLNRTLSASGIPPADIERLSRIREAAEIVLRQTRGLVDYACPPRSPFAHLDLKAVIDRALALCDHEFSRAGLSVRTKFGSTLPVVTGYAEHLTQMFVNLFTNAAHAARPSNAELGIEAFVQEDREWLLVRVRDNGTGIQPSDIEHVFNPFYTTKRESGCGLGLCIVRDIIQQHGGHITVDSTALVGTTFSLLLPVATVTDGIAAIATGQL